MLMVCANVPNLLLVKAGDGRQELAVRAALDLACSTESTKRRRVYLTD
jgi:hypothetical protein